MQGVIRRKKYANFHSRITIDFRYLPWNCTQLTTAISCHDSWERP